MNKSQSKSKKASGEAPRSGKSTPLRRGPKLKQIDFDLLIRLCQIQCTQNEIEAVMGIDIDTISARCKDKYGLKYSDFYKQNRQGGKASLRRQIWKRVEDGSDTMIIWATKNYLGMSDKQEIKHEVTTWTEIERAAAEYKAKHNDSSDGD